MNVWKIWQTGFLVLFSSWASGGTYVLTFDDAPRGDGVLTGEQRTDQLLVNLAKADAKQVVFYCNPGNCPQGNCPRLLKYGRAGHLIANHTANHMRLSDTDVNAYLASIHWADEKLQTYPGYRKWFRYPFLNEATKDVVKHDRVKGYLRAENYLQGYVTVETYDWYLDAQFREATAAGKKVDREKFKQLYVKVLRESMEFYDQLALKTIGYSPIHVLLLHENDINALWIADVVADLKTAGFELAPAEKSFTDPIAEPRWDPIPGSMVRLETTALAKGYKGETTSKWVSSEALQDALDRSGAITP